MLIQPLIGITNSKILPPTLPLPLAHHRLYLLLTYPAVSPRWLYLLPFTLYLLPYKAGAFLLVATPFARPAKAGVALRHI